MFLLLVQLLDLWLNAEYKRGGGGLSEIKSKLLHCKQATKDTVVYWLSTEKDTEQDRGRFALHLN